jgi:hypothetical protein
MERDQAPRFGPLELQNGLEMGPEMETDAWIRKPNSNVLCSVLCNSLRRQRKLDGGKPPALHAAAGRRGRLRLEWREMGKLDLALADSKAIWK